MGRQAFSKREKKFITTKVTRANKNFMQELID
jgi:hypothetical protein